MAVLETNLERAVFINTLKNYFIAHDYRFLIKKTDDKKLSFYIMTDEEITYKLADGYYRLRQNITTLPDYEPKYDTMKTLSDIKYVGLPIIVTNIDDVSLTMTCSHCHHQKDKIFFEMDDDGEYNKYCHVCIGMKMDATIKRRGSGRWGIEVQPA
jgi:hypothetical protein